MNDLSLKHFRETISLCPECYQRIPAFLYTDNGNIMMSKVCINHGKTISMVERDANFYLDCFRSSAPTIYSGYFIDITEKCNLNCKYCYYPVQNKKKDLSIESIVQNAFLHKTLSPFILTGGEPSLRNDLPEIIKALQKIGPVELLTNGTQIHDKQLNTLSSLLVKDGNAAINLSWHPEIKDDNIRFLNLSRKMGIKIESVLFVIDDLKEIDNILEICEEWKDVILATRIKAATKVWNEQKPENKIFVSDLLHYMENYGAKVTWWRNNKVSFVTTELDGIFHMLVSWYDRFNIDILDINCAPYYQAKTGETMNILTAMIINEGLQNGWLNGVKLKEN